MGSLLSTLSSSPPPTEQKRVLGPGEDPKATAVKSEPLFLDEVDAEPASWSQDGLCTTIQRFFGLLPDSQGQAFKNQQQYPVFRHRSPAFVLNIGDRSGAIVTIQRLYRRYRRLRTWHEVSDHMVQIAKGRLAAIRAQEQEEISAASFRLLLSEGFTASKVCISGALKTIHLHLVLNAETGECYITWTPSRKKKPMINLHDIDQVIAVNKDGNLEAPRLSKKVSHRRGVIIVCKTYHRGRVVLEVATKKERNILLKGFQQLLKEMSSTEPTLDDIGALRSQLPRRQSAIDFFSSETSHSSISVAVDDSNPSPRRGSAPIYRPKALAVTTSQDSTDSVRADAKAIEHFYQTRFDDSSQSRRPSRAIEAQQ